MIEAGPVAAVSVKALRLRAQDPRRPWSMGLAMTAIGVILVAVTIALRG